MITKQLNIEIEAGADYIMWFVVRDDYNALVDLTGATVTSQLREAAESSDSFSFTVTHNGQGGKVTMSMAHENTAQIDFSNGVYDVFIDFPDETREKYMMGDVTIIPAVTKPVDGTIMYLLSFASEDDFPVTGLPQRLYFSHASGKMYRWNGSGYVGIVQDGEAATVEVGTVTTLPAGSDATVENVGSLENAVFNFGIPKGEKGDPGEPGTTEWDDIQDKPELYTKDETDALLDDKANTADLGALAEKDSVDWESDIDNIPEAFPPEAHTHDDRYYTEQETDDLLADKADADSLGTLASEDDAPSDGKTYGRKDGDWAEVVSEASWGTITGDISDQTDLAEALADKADVITRSVSAEIVSIADGAPYPVKALTVSIEPIQDLHGQANPYPAGGGKNIVDYTKGYTGFGYNTAVGTIVTPVISETQPTIASNVITFTGGAWSALTFLTKGLSTGTYHVHMNLTENSGSRMTIYVVDGTTNEILATTASTSAIVYDSNQTISKDGDYIAVTIASNVEGTRKVSDLQVESGNAYSSWAPYSNVCPITGWTQAKVTRTGKNLIDPTTKEETSSTVARWHYQKPLKLEAGKTYTLSSDNANVTVYFMDASDDSNLANGSPSKSYTPPTDKMCYFRGYLSSGISAVNLQLENGATATAYEAPNIADVTIPFGQTVYGGTLDVLTGTLTVDRAEMTPINWSLRNAGESNPWIRISGTFPSNRAMWKANKASTYSGGSVPDVPYAIWQYDTSTARIYLPSGSVKADADTYMSGMQIVYPLAEPQTIHLPPAEAITMLKGQNVVWANCGSVGIEYRADTKLYVDQQIAESAQTTRAMIAVSATADSKAPKALSTGDLIIVGDELRKCTANIGNGNAITASNTTVANLADVIKALQ